MSFLSRFKQITVLAITDTRISVRNISRVDKTIVSQHSVDIPTGVITRGIILDNSRLSEALANLQTQTEGSFHKVIFAIPEQQCFTCTCILPSDISDEQIRAQVIAHAKTIIPIHHADMYIGYVQPTPISGTQTQSCTYIAVEGDVFNTYTQIFGTVHIEVSGVTSAEILDPTAFISISDFQQGEGAHKQIQTEVDVPQTAASISLNTVHKKQIATYVFLAIAFAVLGYILYAYVIVLFI